MKANFQPGIHPDADQLSVFLEGAASSHEHERMLAHLAECAECRKAVFLMQPQKETQAPRPEPIPGWTWRRLLPVALPAAALVCAVVALLVYLRPHGGTPEVLQQDASVRQPEIPRPPTTVAPTTDSESFARSESPKKSFAPSRGWSTRPSTRSRRTTETTGATRPTPSAPSPNRTPASPTGESAAAARRDRR